MTTLLLFAGVVLAVWLAVPYRITRHEHLEGHETSWTGTPLGVVLAERWTAKAWRAWNDRQVSKAAAQHLREYRACEARHEAEHEAGLVLTGDRG